MKTSSEQQAINTQQSSLTPGNSEGGVRLQPPNAGWLTTIQTLANRAVTQRYGQSRIQPLSLLPTQRHPEHSHTEMEEDHADDPSPLVQRKVIQRAFDQQGNDQRQQDFQNAATQVNLNNSRSVQGYLNQLWTILNSVDNDLQGLQHFNTPGNTRNTILNRFNNTQGSIGAMHNTTQALQGQQYNPQNIHNFQQGLQQEINNLVNAVPQNLDLGNPNHYINRCHTWLTDYLGLGNTIQNHPQYQQAQQFIEADRLRQLGNPYLEFGENVQTQNLRWQLDNQADFNTSAALLQTIINSSTHIGNNTYNGRTQETCNAINQRANQYRARLEALGSNGLNWLNQENQFNQEQHVLTQRVNALSPQQQNQPNLRAVGDGTQTAYVDLLNRFPNENYLAAKIKARYIDEHWVAPTNQQIVNMAQALLLGEERRVAGHHLMLRPVRNNQFNNTTLPGGRTIITFRADHYQFRGEGHIGRLHPEGGQQPTGNSLMNAQQWQNLPQDATHRIINLGQFGVDRDRIGRPRPPANLSNIINTDPNPNNRNAQLDNPSTIRGADQTGILDAENLHVNAWSLGGENIPSNLVAGSHNLNTAMIPIEGLISNFGSQLATNRMIITSQGYVTQVPGAQGQQVNWLSGIRINISIYQDPAQLQNNGNYQPHNGQQPQINHTFFLRQQDDNASRLTHGNWDAIMNAVNTLEQQINNI